LSREGVNFDQRKQKAGRLMKALVAKEPLASRSARLLLSSGLRKQARVNYVLDRSSKAGLEVNSMLLLLR
jgi:hypothetical protein